ncbi:MAG: Ig-like domain-containing protein [Kiritimatiellae bacterium]|nr:Ig-like domain-containing protein [Kiritimatiellia bacterium]
MLIDECTNEFFQVVFVIDLGSGYNSLYVNGSLIGTASNSGVTDWDGGDGTSLGRFTGTNLGGFINGAANTRYDTYYYGAISIFKIYAGALSADMITHNYNAIHNNTNKSGDPIMVSGIYTNATDVDRRVDADIKLPSGSVMRRSSVDNSLTYTPALSWELYNLWAGMLAPDTFKYEVVDGNSSTNTAEVTLNIQPGSEAEPDEFTVTQGETRHFKRSELVRNDQQILMSPWFELNSAAVTEDDIAAGLWRNLGSSGASRDFTVAGDFVEVASGFGGIGRAWRNVAGFGVGLEGAGHNISMQSSTIEIWFKPRFSPKGDMVLYESGGSTIGMYIVYESNNNLIRVSVDSTYTDQPERLLETRAEGISFDEFNQLLVVYDRDNPGITDSLTIYLNHDPGAAFSSAPAAFHTNTLGSVNDIAGSDWAGIGRVESQAAHNFAEDATFDGEIAIVTIYDRVLETAEMEQRYESVKRGILAVTPVAPAKTTLGASVTLALNGDIIYDASNLSTNLLEGESVADLFTYTISDGIGGTTTTNVTVTVTGVPAVRTVPDTIIITAGEAANNFNPLANDIGFGAGARVDIAWIVYSYRADYVTGSQALQSADFRDENGYGARYMWNAPLNWVDGGDSTMFDTASGAIGETNCYRTLVWSTALNSWQVNSSGTSNDGFPGNNCYFNKTGLHTGLGPGQSRSAYGTNNQARAAIFAYTVAHDGYYAVTNSWMTHNSSNSSTAGSGDGVMLWVYADNTLKLCITNFAYEIGTFNRELDYLTAGSTIYLCLDPILTEVGDKKDWDFDLVLKTAPGFSGDIWNNVALFSDGSTLSFDSNDAYLALGAGQILYETFEYAVSEGGSTWYESVTVEIHGVNEAPQGVADTFNANEDDVLYGSLVANDRDVDMGDMLHLGVSRVEGGTQNLGVPFRTGLGALLTVNADGTFSYDPDGRFESMLPNEFVSESFSYRVCDQHGAEAVSDTTCTVVLEGRDDGVIASDNHYVVKSDRTISGNLITDDTGAGVDITIDANDELSVFSIDTTGLKGTVNVSTALLIAKRGKITNLNHNKQTITYGGAGIFTDPVVFAQPMTRNDPEFAVVRITNVDPLNSTFDIHLTEQPEHGVNSDNDGDHHGNETVSWIVFEAGEYKLLDGTQLQIGKITTDAVRQLKQTEKSWAAVTFGTPFTSQPVVINQLQSYDYTNDLCATRINGTSYLSGSVTSTGFEVAMEDYEYDKDNRYDAYRPETIGWLAIDSSVGLWNGNKFESLVHDNILGAGDYTTAFSHSYSAAPMILACIASYKGSDNCNLRLTSVTASQVTVFLEECQTFDLETDHTNKEALTLLAIEGANDLYAYPQNFTVGAFTFDPDGEFDPAANGPEDVSFTYTLIDLYGNTDTATVTITVVTPYDGTIILLR